MKKYFPNNIAVVISRKFLQEYSFEEANLFKSKIVGCTFVNCDFSYCNLSQASIRDCTFAKCKFDYSALTGAHIDRCSFIHCDTPHSNLSYTHIHDSRFRKCHLIGIHMYIDWHDNIFDEDTIIEACGGSCMFTESELYNLLSSCDTFQNTVEVS